MARARKTRPELTCGLTPPMRLCLCDAANGLLGEIGGRWRRQTRDHFDHAPATVAALVELGMLELLRPDVAQPTYRGRQAVTLIRARRAAVEEWERIKCKSRT